LDEVDVLDRGDFDGLFVVVEPGVGVARLVLAREEGDNGEGIIPARRHGRASLLVADWPVPVVRCLDDVDHLLQQAILLNDWSHDQHEYG